MHQYQAYEEESRRELCRRDGDGIEVRLLWTPITETLTVEVADLRTGDVFELPVGDADPMEVFNHPYYHAGRAGLDADLMAV